MSRRLTRRSVTGRRAAPPAVIALAGMLALAGCSSGGGTPAPPPPPASSSTPTASASPTFEPKPGGTLRVAGTARSVSLDPAAPVTRAGPSAQLSGVSQADAVRLLGRLVLRQLYSYPAQDPVGDEPVATDVPQADLATGAPQLSEDGLTATIGLRAARWAVDNPRRVTSTDALRALKRLCLPSVRSPVAGYLAESVVGYRAACAAITRRPPTTLAALDATPVAGLSTEGDTTLVITLLRPTNDLTAILALPETSPLPVESFQGLTVTSDPLRFVGDGPYRFVAPVADETYALSRSLSWGDDPLRRAYVDHVSVRGGLTAAQVRAAVAAGEADLSLDVPAASTTALPDTPTPALVSHPGRASVLLAVGSSGPQAARLAVPGVRRVLAACLDEATRTRIARGLGSGVATPQADLLAGLGSTSAAAPTPSPGASGASTAPTPSATPSAVPATRPRCAPTLGVTGASLRMLVPDVAQLRAVAGLVSARFAVAGATVTPVYAPASRIAALTRAGGWDLLLDARPLAYPQPRALLAPLLDPRWIGTGRRTRATGQSVGGGDVRRDGRDHHRGVGRGLAGACWPDLLVGHDHRAGRPRQSVRNRLQRGAGARRAHLRQRRSGQCVARIHASVRTRPKHDPHAVASPRRGHPAV